jgi:hypothetical protein
MLASWRHAYANVFLASGNLVFLLIALKSPTPTGISLSAGIVGLTSLYAWYVNLQRFSAVADTPTSRVSSAPQGYIELAGKGAYPPGEQLVSHITGLPCLWYRFIIEEKNGNKWHRINSGVSTEVFGLDDGTGMVLVDPDEAEVITSNKHVITSGRYRHTEWTLIEGDKLYVLGEHLTVGGASTVLDLREDVSNLLGEWKQDMASLLGRFDQNGDGKISLEEWELARRAAIKQVAREHKEIRLRPGIHLLNKPTGRLFLIANRTPEEMVLRYRLWALAHLGLLMAACITIAVML